MSDLGKKFDGEKIPHYLVSSEAIDQLSLVLAAGAKKYGEWNWADGISYTRIIAAILRHTYAYLRGESKDPETNLSHIAHVMCNCMFLLHFEKYKPELDNRPKIYETSKMSSK